MEKDKALQRARDEVAQLRNRVSHMQADLENTEKVSLDFVRLSQHLQVRLISAQVFILLYDSWLVTL